jgi:hypothetical protein
VASAASARAITTLVGEFPLPQSDVIPVLVQVTLLPLDAPETSNVPDA